MYGTEHLINTASLLIPQCYLTFLVHTKSYKDCPREPSLRYLQEHLPCRIVKQCALNSLLWPKVVGYIFTCKESE